MEQYLVHLHHDMIPYHRFLSGCRLTKRFMGTDSLCFTVSVNVVYIRMLIEEHAIFTIFAKYIFDLKRNLCFNDLIFFNLVCVLVYITAANLLVS